MAKFSKDDVVKIVDPFWGIEDPSEYTVISSFVMEDYFTRANVTMYEIVTEGGHRALVQEGMLRLVRSAIHVPSEEELADIFGAMDEMARLASVDQLLDQRSDWKLHLELLPIDSEAERCRAEMMIARIDKQLRKLTFKKGQ